MAALENADRQLGRKNMAREINTKRNKIENTIYVRVTRSLMLACMSQVSANFVNTAARQFIFAEAKGEQLAGKTSVVLKPKLWF